MDKFAQGQLIEKAVLATVEFFRLAPVTTSKSYQLFSVEDGADEAHPYLKGIRDSLVRAQRIFIFHDSSG